MGGVGGASGTGPGGVGGGATTQCAYPSGPYGVQVGATVQPTLSWQGFPEGQSQATTISIQDYFDCDGTRGVNAILVTQSASWCGACKEHAGQLNGLIAGGWAQKGIHALVLVIENSSGAPATLATADSWKTAFQPQGWAVGADPGFSFASFGGTGLPLLIVIDPRTMKVVERREGLYSDHYALEQLAAQNGG